MRACSNETYCHYLFERNPENCSSDPKKRYPGEYCTENEECISNNCDSERCKASKAGDCEDHYECDVGYFCNSTGKCENLIPENKTCGPDKKCHVNLICNQGTCIKYGSVPNDEKASAPAACKSHFIAGNKTCQEGYKLESPKEACKENKCIYTRSNEKITRECSCGITEEGNSYCNLGEADIDLKPVLLNNLLVL